jgi:hypothetical protein
MKPKLHYLICIEALILGLILSGCASTNKSVNYKKKIKDNEIAYFDNNVIIDPVSNYLWEMFEDNPTTYYRFKLNSNNNVVKLPSLNQMIDFLEKISYQLESKKSHGNVAESGWFETDCDFLTSSSVTTPEGEILYEVVHWNSASRSLQKNTVTGGDLVVIILINENL